MDTELHNQFRNGTETDGQTTVVKTTRPTTTSEAVDNRERIRIDPIAAAEAKLKQKEAKLAESRNLLQQRKRKVRNGQLFVWGAMVESAYRYGDPDQRRLLRTLAERYLTDERHRQRSDFGFTRVDNEREEAKP